MLLLEPNADIPVRRNQPSKKGQDNNNNKQMLHHQSTGISPSSAASERLRSNLLHKLGISNTSSHQEHPVGNAEPSRGSLLGNVKEERIPLKDAAEMRANKRQRQKLQPSLLTSASSSSAALASKCHKVGSHTPADAMVEALGALWASSRLSLPTTKKEEEEEEAPPSTNKDDPLSSVREENDGDDNSSSSSKHVRFQPEVAMVPIPTRHEYSKRIRDFLWEPVASMQANVLRNTVEYTADGWNWEEALDEDEHYIDPSTGELIHPIHLEIAQMSQEDRDMILPRNYTSPVATTTLPHPMMPLTDEDVDGIISHSSE